ncbi:hypothetical protein J2T02_002025 [Chitinophaga terrae (ex Kim and Jung 2007)]|uniref:hypothetical protein n=1 Tax=Chitinophaga terrae (ex Kim and Jung 2007) TaxID=408074 RepID=UPI0027884B6D|nr:hypothetical protein [Chitinophaga terrae (ex Kim and Jung 2007)]MDQ0106912.1 hypothetical protein [Chitinophaga terrae (ex Kim and Jung 2007)]
MKQGDSLVVKAISPVTEKMLQQFSSSIMPYVNFYQNLNNSSLVFSNDLKLHKAKYDDYFPAINTLSAKFKDELNIDIRGLDTPVKDQVDQLFEFGSAKSLNFYKAMLQKNEVKKVNGFTLQTVQLARDFKSFYNDYYRLLLKNFDDNLSILEDAKKLQGSDATTITNLIARLNTLRKGTDKNDPGFEVKFKDNLELVLSKLSQIGLLD